MDDTFRNLEQFLLKEMSMSHVYQPAMLLELLRSGGSAFVNHVAMDLLQLDGSQFEYCKQTTKYMVGRVPFESWGLTERKGNELEIFPVWPDAKGWQGSNTP